jgi:hypothetical protein
MRGSVGAPAAIASRSDHSPAHATTAPAVVVGLEPSRARRRRSAPSPRSSIASTPTPVSTVPPSAARSSASAVAILAKSTTPVDGE